MSMSSAGRCSGLRRQRRSQAESDGDYPPHRRAAYDGGPATNAYVIEGFTGVIIYLNRKYKSKHGSIKITGID